MTRSDAGPVVFGYVSVAAGGPVDGNTSVDSWRHQMARFADREGLTLPAIFADVRGAADAFYNMLEWVRRDAAAAVVVPDLSHLAHLACLAGADVRSASRYIRAQVMTLPATDRGSELPPAG